MRKITLLSILFMFVFSLIALAQIDFSSKEKVASSLEQLNQELQGQELIGSLGKFFGNEVINLYVEPNNLSFSIVTKDKKIDKIEMGETEKPSLEVFTSEAVITEIQSSSNQIKALRKAIQEEKITYKAIGLGNKIKFTFLKMFFKVTEEDKADKVGETIITEDKTTVIKEVEKIREEEKPKKEENHLENSTVPLTESNTDHIIEIVKEGFSPRELKIKKGDTIEWKVTRNGNLNKAMVLGTGQCVQARSKILSTGDTFSWTFDQAQRCNIVDGITTTQTGLIIVEE